jgi:hypothetical protein
MGTPLLYFLYVFCFCLNDPLPAVLELALAHRFAHAVIGRLLVFLCAERLESMPVRPVAGGYILRLTTHSLLPMPFRYSVSALSTPSITGKKKSGCEVNCD